MADTAKNLDYVLGLAYQAEAMGKKPVSLAEGLFRSAANDDPAFTPMAKQRLGQLKAVEPRQCFISKTTADFLSRMLAS